MIALTQSGTYTLVVGAIDPGDFRPDAGTGTYRLEMLDLTAAPVAAADVTIDGTLSSGSTSGATFYAAYRVTGAAGQVIYLKDLSTQSDVDAPRWALSEADGNELASAPLVYQFSDNNLQLTLPYTGSFTFLLSNPTGQSLPYSFRFTIPGVTTQPLALGSTASGNIAASGERDEYTFTGTPGQFVYFDALQGFEIERLLATLISPSGLEQLLNPIGRDSPLLRLSEPGTYRVVVSSPPVLGLLGPYQFRMLDAAEAVAVNVGDTVSGTLSPGKSATIYRLSGTAGQHLVLHDLPALGSTDRDSMWTLYDPTGQALGQSWLFSSLNRNDIDAVLPFTGTYTIVISGAASVSAPFSFQVTAV